MKSLSLPKMCAITPRWRQYAAVIVCSLSMFTSWLHYSWTSPTLPKLYAIDSPIRTTQMEGSLLAAIGLSADIIGAPVGAFISAYLSRKICLLIAVTPYLISWILIYLAENVNMLLFARWIIGLSDGMSFTIVPIFIAEISDKDIRGRMGNMIMILGNLGSLFMYTLGPILSIREMAAVSSVFVVLIYIFFPLFPESPYHCLLQKNRVKATKCLQKYRGVKDVTNDINEIETHIREQNQMSSSLIEVFRGETNRRSLFISLGLKTIQQFSGIPVILVFTQIIFEDAQSGVSPAHSAIFIGVAQLISACCSSFFIDRIGRRPLLMISGFGCGISLLMVGGFFYVQKATTYDVTFMRYLPIVGLILFMCLYGFGLGCISYSMPSELFPINVKTKAMSIVHLYMEFCAFSMIMSYQWIVAEVGTHWAFFFYGMCSLTGAGFTYVWVPETKGRTLEEIQMDLQLKGKKRRCEGL